MLKQIFFWTILLFSIGAAADRPVDFELAGVDGKMHRLSDYRGKWVVVNYWATWCPPCLEEIPDLVDFHDRHKDRDAVVLGVNFEDISDKWLHQFVDEQFISYPVLKGQPGARSALGAIPGLPTTFIVSPEGVPMARQVGPVTGKMLDDYIAKKSRKAGHSPVHETAFSP